MLFFIKYATLAMTATVLLLSSSTTPTDAVGLYSPYVPASSVNRLKDKINVVRTSLKLPPLEWSRQLSWLTDHAIHVACRGFYPPADHVLHIKAYPKSTPGSFLDDSRLQTEFDLALADWKTQARDIKLLSNPDYKSVGCAIEQCGSIDEQFNVKIICQFAK